MSDILIEMETATAAAGRQLARCGGVETLSVADYCRLAEECLLLAVVAKDRQAAAELLEAGDDYLRCAAGLA